MVLLLCLGFQFLQVFLLIVPFVFKVFKQDSRMMYQVRFSDEVSKQDYQTRFRRKVFKRGFSREVFKTGSPAKFLREVPGKVSKKVSFKVFTQEFQDWFPNEVSKHSLK